MARFGDFDQYLDNAGDPLAEGKLYFYESGTTTPKLTYADINNSIPNTNPVLLSAAGRQPNIFFDGVAKVILTDKNDVQISVRDPVGSTGTGFGDAWVATKIYSANDVVLGSDGTYYRSQINGNQNNNPVTTTGFWVLLYSVEWNPAITYQEGAVVTYDGEQFQSLTNSNFNNNPSTSPLSWTLLSFSWISTAEYAEDQNAVGPDGILYTSLQDGNIGNDPATSPTYWVGTSAAAAASALAAYNSELAAAASEAAAAASETAAAASEAAAATSATDSSNSATASANSATESASSASASAASATASAGSATASAASATEAANTLDQFQDIYLGEKPTDPTTDNDGNPLQTGALYFNTTTTLLRVYTGSAWQDTAAIVTSVSWGQITDAPDYNGEAGKFLASDGASISWQQLETGVPYATVFKFQF